MILGRPTGRGPRRVVSSRELDTQNELGVRIVQRYWTGIGCLEFFLHVSQFCPISCPETISIFDCLLELVNSEVLRRACWSMVLLRVACDEVASRSPRVAEVGSKSEIGWNGG
jgi:hypothetical protein